LPDKLLDEVRELPNANMPVNIWKESLKDTPKENLNKRLWFSIFVFGLMGAARGIDEGLIGTSSTLKPFRTTFGLDKGSKVEQAQLLSNIASMVQMGSILGALIACVITGMLSFAVPLLGTILKF